MLTKILLCTDGSTPSVEATKITAVLAKALNAYVMALSVVDIGATAGGFGMIPDSLPCTEAAIDYAKQQQTETLSQAVKLLAEHGVTATQHAEYGNVLETILSFAKREAADLIVVGSHGRSGLSLLLLGSTADRVVHHAEAPVLVVRGQCTPIRNVLLAFDGSEPSRRAAGQAARLAQALGASLNAIHVADSDAAPMSVGARDLIEHRLEQTLGALCPDIYLPFQYHREEGRPAEVILEHAVDTAADLIVMGNRGVGGFRRLLVGSVADTVMHHAHCPVLIAR